MQNEKVLVLDFGGQYNQLIARRVRECNVYCEVHPYNMPIDKIKAFGAKGIIFTGGPNSVFGEDSPKIDKEIFRPYRFSAGRHANRPEYQRPDGSYIDCKRYHT